MRELIELLRSKYVSTESHSRPFDLARKIQYFTLDVISTVGFGQAFGDIKADADLNGYIASGEEGLMVVTISAALGLTPILQWPPLARLLGPSEKDAGGFGKMMAVVRGIIDQRLTQSLEGKSDMLASFVHHGLSKEDVFSEAVLQVLAGSDTTATAIRCIMLYLCSHPRVYSKLQAEIDAEVASGRAEGSDGAVPDSCTRSMRYLQAVIREGLRVHPPVTDAVPKLVPKDGDRVTIDGKELFLPGGTNVSYCAYGLHHDKRIFGEDADIFRPERWLVEDGNEARISVMQRTTELIFGYGKFQCLGKPVAWMEISKIVFEVSSLMPSADKTLTGAVSSRI